MIIQVRRGTPGQWAADNPVLAFGEPGWDGTTFKVGTGTTPWASLPAVAGGAPSSGTYPLSAYGFHSASGEPATFTGNSTLTHAFYARCFVPAGKVITVAAAMVRNIGTVGAGGRNGFAVYDDTGVQLGVTVDDNALWTATGWAIKAFPTPIPASTVDRFVWAGAGSDGYTAAPNIAYLINNSSPIITGGGYNVTHRRAFFDSVTTWPASFNPQAYGTDPGGFLPLIALG